MYICTNVNLLPRSLLECSAQKLKKINNILEMKQVCGHKLQSKVKYTVKAPFDSSQDIYSEAERSFNSL